MSCHYRQAEQVINSIYKIHIERIVGDKRYCVACGDGLPYPCDTVRALEPDWEDHG
jgi:hypothetical protein